jgi:hypothetical protein
MFGKNCVLLYLNVMWYKTVLSKLKIICLFLGLNNVMGLAVDWIGNNLFWTDEGLRAIFVTSLSDSSKTTR